MRTTRRLIYRICVSFHVAFNTRLIFDVDKDMDVIWIHPWIVLGCMGLQRRLRYHELELC